jgi:hypothetical protein
MRARGSSEAVKAFLITLIVLVVLGGVAFYFGWIQIHLPANTYAVIFTKTSGFDNHVIRPGTFVWRWERLIPSNLTLYRFNLEPYQSEQSVQWALPSADLYSAVLPNSPSFTLKARVLSTFELRPESLPALVEKQGLRPDKLDSFYQQQAQELASLVLKDVQGLPPERLVDPALAPGLLQELSGQLPDLALRSLRLQDLQLPDLTLYALAQQSYRSLVEARDRARNEAQSRLAEQEAAAQGLKTEQAGVLDLLGEYGKLLNQYPILLKAMAVDRLSGEQLLQLPEFQPAQLLQQSGTP